MKNLTQVKAIAKKRHELLIKRLETTGLSELVRSAQAYVEESHKPEYKHYDLPAPLEIADALREFKGIKLSDIYETMAIEAGFKDWNAYSAFLKSEPHYKDFPEELKVLRDILFTMDWKLAPATAKVIESLNGKVNVMSTDQYVYLGVLHTYPELRCIENRDLFERDDYMDILRFCATSKSKGVWFPSSRSNYLYFFKGITDEQLADLIQKHTTLKLDEIGFYEYEKGKHGVVKAMEASFENLDNYKASTKNIKTFEDVVMYVLDDKNFMKEYDRLRGTRFSSKPKSTIESMIDQATGHVNFTDKEGLEFVEFVKDVIWDRLPEESFEPVKV